MKKSSYRPLRRSRTLRRKTLRRKTLRRKTMRGGTVQFHPYSGGGTQNKIPYLGGEIHEHLQLGGRKRRTMRGGYLQGFVGVDQG